MLNLFQHLMKRFRNEFGMTYATCNLQLLIADTWQLVPSTWQL